MLVKIGFCCDRASFRKFIYKYHTVMYMSFKMQPIGERAVQRDFKRISDNGCGMQTACSEVITQPREMHLSL